MQQSHGVSLIARQIGYAVDHFARDAEFARDAVGSDTLSGHVKDLLDAGPAQRLCSFSRVFQAPNARFQEVLFLNMVLRMTRSLRMQAV